MTEKSSKNISLFEKSQFLVGHKKKLFTANIFCLCHFSSVFKVMLCGEFEQEGSIEITDVEPDAFKTMLRYINGGDVTFNNKDHAERVLYAADKYDMPHLKTKCADYLYPTTVDDIWCALECGLLYNIDSLKDGALKVAREKTSKVFASKQFLTLSKDALKLIVQEDKLIVDSEVKILKAIRYWARNQCLLEGSPFDHKSIQEKSAELKQYIRFLTLTEQEVLKHGKYILTTDEMKRVLKCINTESDVESLQSLSHSQKKRNESKSKNNVIPVYQNIASISYG